MDKEAASKIAPRDTQKIIRAIEIRMLAGKPVGEIHRGGRDGLEGYNVIKIGFSLPRDALYARINARVEAMMRSGWMEEVRGLVASGVSGRCEAIPVYRLLAICVTCLEGSRRAKEDAVKQIQQATRQFAKRQLTWFRKEPNVHWLPGFGDDPEIVTAALRIAQVTA